jgi:H+/Cl- antiporter ClcA
MRKTLTEQTFIFITVIKWLLLATILGVVVGIGTAIFLKALDWGVGLSHQYRYYYLAMPLAFLFCSWLVRKLLPEEDSHGTEKVIEALHKHSGRLKPIEPILNFFTPLITIISGGSAGKEGPCAEIGAGLSSMLSTLFKLDNYDRRKMVICGISAGFAAAFGTPIAGAIYGVEVLYVGSILYDVLLPSFVAGIISFQVASQMGVTYFSHNLSFVPAFTNIFFLKVLLAGIFFGLCSFLLIETFELTGRITSKFKPGSILKPLLGGVLLIGFASLFSTQYLGLGLDTTEGALLGDKVPGYAFLAKILFTAITLNFGGNGGIVTPLFFIGATSGSFFANLFHLDSATFAALGFTALVAGSANTPIAASIMAVELFGSPIAPYAALVCVISFIITGHRSIYPSQILAFRKSRYVKLNTGVELDNLEMHFKLRKNSLPVRFLIFMSDLYERLFSSRKNSRR